MDRKEQLYAEIKKIDTEEEIERLEETIKAIREKRVHTDSTCNISFFNPFGRTMKRGERRYPVSDDIAAMVLEEQVLRLKAQIK